MYENGKTARKAFQKILFVLEAELDLTETINEHFRIFNQNLKNPELIINDLILYLEISLTAFKIIPKYVYIFLIQHKYFCLTLVEFLKSQFTIIRYLASKCIAFTFPLLEEKEYQEVFVKIFKIFYTKMYEMYEDPKCEFSRQGVSDFLLNLIFYNQNSKNLNQKI